MIIISQAIMNNGAVIVRETALFGKNTCIIGIIKNTFSSGKSGYLSYSPDFRRRRVLVKDIIDFPVETFALADITMSIFIRIVKAG